MHINAMSIGRDNPISLFIELLSDQSEYKTGHGW
jgi:hypothetical protein